MGVSRDPHPSCSLTAPNTPSRCLGHPQDWAGQEWWRSLDSSAGLCGSRPVGEWSLLGVYFP